jgi:hypothetical protein
VDAWFVNPNLLWFVSLASLPWIMRLLFRVRYRTIPWGSNRLMAAAVENVRSRTSWLQWLLLLVQSLTLALLGVSLASPVGTLESLTGSSEDSSRLCWILVLDDSSSMEYSQAEQNHFQLSVEQALDVVSELSRRDAVALVSMASENPDVIGTPTFHHETARQQLKDWVTQPHQADLNRTLAYLQQQVSAIKSSGVPFNQIRILFWSDMSKRTWQTLAAEDFTRQFAALENGAVAQVIDLGDFSSGNVTVERIDDVPRFVAEDHPFELSVTVTNQDPNLESAIPIRASIDGEFVKEKEVTLQPLESQRVSIALKVTGKGNHWVKIEVPEDTLPADNQGWAVVEVPGDIDVVCWSDQADERVYLEQGLGALSRPGLNLNVRAGTPEELMRYRSPYTLLVVGDVADLTAAQSEAINEHLNNRGGIMIFAGPHAQPWQTLGSITTAWSNSADWQTRSGLPLQLEWPAPPSALMKGFGSRAQETILQTPVWTQWRVPESGDVEFENGLNTQQAGVLLGTLVLEQGQCVFWLSGLDPESARVEQGEPWSALAIWPSYIPLLSRMLERALGDASNLNQTIPELAEDSRVITEDFSRWKRITPLRVGGEVPASTQAGVYSENLGLGQTRLHALNVAGAEFRGARVSVESLPEWFDSSQDLESVPQERVTEGGAVQWYQALLLAVVVLMVVELGLYRQLLNPVTRFARPRRRRPN